MRGACVTLVLALAACTGSGTSSSTPAPLGAADVVPAGAHSHGLYTLESDGSGTPFRWTDGDATITGPPLPRAPVSMKLDVYALQATHAKVLVDGKTVFDGAVAAGPATIAAPLGGTSRTPEMRVITPTFRPPLPGGGTGRTLGIEVRDLRYVTDAGSVDLVLDPLTPAVVEGFDPIEHDPDGAPFRWTKGNALVRTPAAVGGTYTLALRAYHRTPVTVGIDGKTVAHVDVEGPSSVEVHFTRGASHVLRIASPTYTPQPVNGYTRSIGVQVTGLRP